jgi:peptidoglycan/LPS O-acetylase OafA/YrhL
MRASAHKEQVMRHSLAEAAPAVVAERVPLSLEMAVDLVLCGVLFAALSLMSQKLHPDFPRLTFFTGVAGGGLCVLWGLLGRRAPYCRLSAIVTLATIACVAIYQAARAWGTSTEGESTGRLVAAMMTLLVVFCVGTLANLAQEGKGPQP